MLLECCQCMLCPWLKAGDQMPERKEHCAKQSKGRDMNDSTHTSHKIVQSLTSWLSEFPV